MQLVVRRRGASVIAGIGASLLRALSLVLTGLLLIVPPGSSACWPLPDGRHLHIGWSDASGHDTPSISVFVHGADEPAQAPHQLALNPLAHSEAPAGGQVLALQIGLWLILPAALYWREFASLLVHVQPGPTPARFPPRLPVRA